jgi:ATP-dependent exoDNAse (exonuclease V) alpha subunit
MRSVRRNRQIASVTNRDLSRWLLFASLDNKCQFQFNANEHRHFDHGYAVTSHSSQGLTAKRVLVHADTSVHLDLLNSRFAYASLSRASGDVQIYTNDASDLANKLSNDMGKLLRSNTPSRQEYSLPILVWARVYEPGTDRTLVDSAPL